MTITLEQLSKRFQRHWIFRDINYTFQNAGAYALLGANGSGKSTLLRIIAGMQSPSKGKMTLRNKDAQPVEPTEVFKHVSFCAPSQELVEEFTLREFLDFHFSFKPLLPTLSVEQVIALTGLGPAADRHIGDYSSGMRQRVKLAQAIFSDTPVLLLDEPCTNLDEQGVEQYRNWMEQYGKGRLVIVASNDVREHYFCTEQLRLQDYK